MHIMDYRNMLNDKTEKEKKKYYEKKKRQYRKLRIQDKIQIAIITGLRYPN